MTNKFSCFLTQKGRWLTATLFLLFTMGIGQMWGTPQDVTFGTAVGTKGYVYSSSSVADATILTDKCVYYSSAKNTVSLSSEKIIAYRLSLIFRLNTSANVDAVIGKNKNKDVSYVLYSLTSTQYDFIKGMSGVSDDVATAYVALANDHPMKTLFKDAGISANDASRQKLLSAVDVADVTTKLYTSDSYTTSTSEVTTIPIWKSATGDNKAVLPAGYYAIYIDCGSSSGNTLDKLSFTAASSTPDTQAPTLSESTPANEATGVSVSGNIVLTMSENVSVANASSFSLSPSAGVTLSTPSVSGTVITIPYSGLANTTEYTFTAAAGAIQDGAATPNTNAAFSFTFTTAAACTAPTITTDLSSTQVEYTKNATASALEIEATGDALTYQWYSNTSNTTEGGTSLGSTAQSASYTPSTAAIGTKYYYCVVSSGVCTTTSAIANIKVNAVRTPGWVIFDGMTDASFASGSIVYNTVTVNYTVAGNSMLDETNVNNRNQHNDFNSEFIPNAVKLNKNDGNSTGYVSFTIPENYQLTRIILALAYAGGGRHVELATSAVTSTTSDDIITQLHTGGNSDRIYSVDYLPTTALPAGTYYICAPDGGSWNIFHLQLVVEAVPSCTTPPIAWATTPADATEDAVDMTASVTIPDGQTVTWTSSNTDVATVSNAGVIDYKTPGTTTIKAEYTYSGSVYCEEKVSISKEITVTAHVPTVADLVTIDADYTFTPSATLTANTLYEGGKIISLGDGNPYTSGKGIRIKENRAIAFKVAANAKVKATFVQDGNIEMQLGTATADDDNKAYGHSKTSPKVFDVITTGGVVYLTASNQLDLSKLEIFYPHTVTYNLNGGDGTLPTESAHYVGDKFNLHDGEDGITAPTDKEFAGWNDGTTTYIGGAEYTMGASAVMLTAQWATPLPAPTITFNNGNYTIAGAALDLSTLFSSNSDGAVTYTVKTAGETGATIAGTSFTATAAGSAVVTASQAATASYKAKSVDATITISAPTEPEGVKLVVANALTGNFRSGRSLSDGSCTVAGISYSKYVTMGSTYTSWGPDAGPSGKYFSYTVQKKSTRFYFYVNNTGSAAKIHLYTSAEGSAAAATKNDIDVAAGTSLVTYDLTTTTNTEVFIGVSSTNIRFCQIIAVESGDSHLTAPAVGYAMSLNKGRLSTASGTATTIDGLTFVVSSGYKPAYSTEAQVGTKGTHYVSFTIPDGQTRQLQLTTSNTNKYTVSKTKGDDQNQFTPTANTAKNWNLTAGTWYINPQGSNVNITNIVFAAAPTSYTVTFDADGGSSVDDQIVFEGGKATEPTAPTKSGYDFIGWYNGADLYDFDGVVSANLTLTAHWTVHVTNDATLKSLKYGEQSIALEDGVYEYNVELPYYTVGVPELTAVTNSADAKTPVITNAAALDANNQATSTVSVTSEDETVTLLYQVHFTKVVLYEWQEVSGSINWDFTNAALAQIKLVDNGTPVAKDEEAVMANIPGTTNNATFNSQALKFKGEYIHRSDDGTNYPSCATTIKFKTTVPGVVTVRYADNGGNNRCLSINGHLGAASSSKTDYKTYSVCVPAGEVVLTGHKGSEDDKYIRFFEIDFKAASDLDPTKAEESTLGGYERDVTEGRYGTICLPNGGVMAGASIYTLAYYGETSQKIFFDEVLNGTMEAGKPYLFLPNEGIDRIGVFYTDAANEPNKTVNGFVGYIGASEDPNDALQVPAGDGNYIVQNNQYREIQAGATAYILSHRAYIHFAGINTSEPAKAPGARRIGISGAPQVATGIDALNAAEAPVKVMIDGQLFILRGEKMYDATGRLVK